MVKVIVGLMGSSAASGSTTLSGADQLRPFLTMLSKHNVHELDTARAYNKGQSEQDLGAIPTAQSDFSIATKAPGFSPGSLSYQNVLDACQASLAALNQEKIDLYYFHGPDRKTPLEESCRAIHELHRTNKIARFGVSNFNSQEVEEMHSICSRNGWILPTVYQGIYNPLTRTGETALIPALRKLRMNFYAFSPLAGGYFSKPTAQLRHPAPLGSRMDQMKHFATMYVSDLTLRLHEQLTQVCEREGVTVRDAALRWLMHHSVLGEGDGVVLGGSSEKQMEANLEACEGGRLPERVVECLEEVWREFRDAGLAPPASM